MSLLLQAKPKVSRKMRWFLCLLRRRWFETLRPQSSVSLTFHPTSTPTSWLLRNIKSESVGTKVVPSCRSELMVFVLDIIKNCKVLQVEFKLPTKLPLFLNVWYYIDIDPFINLYILTITFWKKSRSRGCGQISSTSTWSSGLTYCGQVKNSMRSKLCVPLTTTPCTVKNNISVLGTSTVTTIHATSTANTHDISSATVHHSTIALCHSTHCHSVEWQWQQKKNYFVFYFMQGI